MDIATQEELPTPLHAVTAAPPDPAWQHLPVVWRKPGMLAASRLTTGLTFATYVAELIPTGAPTTSAAALFACHALYEFAAACLRPARR
ncbi:hypothetical protein [Streptomyces sp. NBC_00057]|uniref:hypothetical protein n=1 Tax=Streptomyces sp. NBC_00057 TaxID=2975634 RepID=UPI0032467205